MRLAGGPSRQEGIGQSTHRSQEVSRTMGRPSFLEIGRRLKYIRTWGSTNTYVQRPVGKARCCVILPPPPPTSPSLSRPPRQPRRVRVAVSWRSPPRAPAPRHLRAAAGGEGERGDRWSRWVEGERCFSGGPKVRRPQSPKTPHPRKHFPSERPGGPKARKRGGQQSEMERAGESSREGCGERSGEGSGGQWERAAEGSRATWGGRRAAG